VSNFPGDVWVNGVLRCNQEVSAPFVSFGGPAPRVSFTFPAIVTPLSADPTVSPGYFGGAGSFGILIVPPYGVYQKIGTLDTDWVLVGGGSSPSAQNLDEPYTNADGSSIVLGQPVYFTIAPQPSVALAAANANLLVGLVADASIANAAIGKIRIGGVLEQAAAAWEAITDGATGIAGGETVYVSPTTPGKLTTTAPSTSGQYITVVGIAMSTTLLQLQIAAPFGPL
jgi:hypothetical protein